MCKRLAALALALLTLLSLPAMAAEEVPVPITVHAQCWNSHVYVCEDGKKFFMGAIDAAGHVRSSLTYNGTVYVPLRTAGLWLGADAVWTAETAAARLTTGQFKSFLKADYDEQRDNYNVFQARTETMQRQEELERTRGMDVELRPDVTLLLDGAPQHFQNAQGEPIYPIRWNDEVWGDELWVPLRGVAQMMGKRILWSPPVAEGLPSDAQFGIYPGSIVLYDAPTQEELAQAEPVLAAVEQCVGEMRALTEEMAAAEELTKDTIQVWLDKLLEKVAAAEGLSGADVAFPPMKSIWFADSYTNGARLRQMILDQSRQTDAFVNTLQATGEEWVQFRNGLTNSWFESISRMEGQIAEARGLLEGAKAVEAAEE